MSEEKINNRVLMSGADYFSDEFAINAYMDSEVAIDLEKAKTEHQFIINALEMASVEVVKVNPPIDCQDGVYTANWGLCRNNKVVLSNLPNKRKGEEQYAKEVLTNLGFQTITCPYRFSGQGDALPCGNYLFMGTGYRTDMDTHAFVADQLGFEVISLQTVPKLDSNNQLAVNSVTGWIDSFFYDIDLALAVISQDLIAWCPEAFSDSSKEKINNLNIQKIEVSYKEATEGFACNLISNEQTVIMSSKAPELQRKLDSLGFTTITPPITELAKGGGYIRCTTLTLN